MSIQWSQITTCRQQIERFLCPPSRHGRGFNLMIHICVTNFGRQRPPGHASCIETDMTRTYTMKRRAEQQGETRRRIVEAAVDLHGSVGPAATTFSMIAERAGVQRHTLYAHFPDERSLLMACSGLFEEREPAPDAG